MPPGPRQIAEPVLVLVLHHLVDELAAMVLQAGHDVIDVIHREHEAPDAERIGRGARLGVDRGRRVELGAANALSAAQVEVDSDVVYRNGTSTRAVRRSRVVRFVA